MTELPKEFKPSRRARRVDIASLTLNVAQIAGLAGLIWTAATWKAHQDDAQARADERLIQLQNQMGETNARLLRIENPPARVPR